MSRDFLFFYESRFCKKLCQEICEYNILVNFGSILVVIEPFTLLCFRPFYSFPLSKPESHTLYNTVSFFDNPSINQRFWRKWVDWQSLGVSPNVLQKQERGKRGPTHMLAWMEDLFSSIFIFLLSSLLFFIISSLSSFSPSFLIKSWICCRESNKIVCMFVHRRIINENYGLKDVLLKNVFFLLVVSSLLMLWINSQIRNSFAMAVLLYSLCNKPKVNWENLIARSYIWVRIFYVFKFNWDSSFCESINVRHFKVTQSKIML